jgi:colanic acid/amylovoran biosynthesis glycosyltransferase
LMIDALERVSTSGIPLELVMVGEGPLRAEVEAYARGRLPDVRILDRLSQPEIVALLASARVYLHGSITLANGHAEALGLANLEAQAVGTPVVAFDSGGVAETIEPGRTGFAVPEHDINAMADAVARLLLDDGQWGVLSASAASMVAERFAIRAQTALLEELYDEVLAHFTASVSRAGKAA